MNVNVPLLLLAFVLLWIPRRWLRLGAVLARRRSRSPASKNLAAQEPWNARERGDLRVDFRSEFLKLRNYVDLGRAAAGGWCIVGGLGIESCLRVAVDAPPSLGHAMMAVQALVLLVGLLLQAVRYEQQRFTFFPPIFYLAGLSVPLCEPYAAVFAFVAIWAINPAFGSAQGFLTVYAGLMVLFGQYFSGLGDKTVLLAAVLCFLPVLLSLLANRPLVIFTRKARRPAESTA